MNRPFDLRARRHRPEVMDQPGLDAGLHAEALRGLERINWWSRTARLLWPWLRQAARAAGGRPLAVLDVATGAGDVPIRLWHLARRAGLALRLDGCDRSAFAVEYARRRAAAAGAEVHFFPRDALAGELPGGYDVALCSLFLHHLTEEQAVRLLGRLAAAARRLLVCDLRRGLGGMVFAQLGTRLLSNSPVVRCDGPLSAAAAFTCDEARALAHRAGLAGADVRAAWPYRFLLRWDQSPPARDPHGDRA